MPVPYLTFFCELETDPLDKLLSPAMLASMKSMRAGLSMAILDFSDHRAEVVKRLNQAGIPVTAWLLLPREQGYYFNLRNATEAAALYPTFKEWTARHGLQWSAVGLDIEPDIRDIDQFGVQRWRALPQMLQRLGARKVLANARDIYQRLVKDIRADGYLVESYQMFFIADDRLARSTILQRVTGILDLPVDREVMMIYTNYAREANGQVAPALLWSYAPSAQAIGLGSTGGDVETLYGAPEPLSWSELARDLRIAWKWTDDIYIFSLEGCVKQGFFDRLKGFVWDKPIMEPEEGLVTIEARRKGMHALLWVGSHAWIVIATVVSVSIGIIFLSRFFRSRK